MDRNDSGARGRLATTPIAPRRHSSDEGFERRIKTPALQRIYRHWRSAFIDGPHFPAFETFDFSREDIADHTFALAIEGDDFRFVAMGSALCERLGRSLTGTTIGSDGQEIFGSNADSYRQCAAHESPSYEYVRYAIPDQRSLLFERLLLPFFSDTAVTHIGGVALFTDLSSQH
jgi:hypothetical protein